MHKRTKTNEGGDSRAAGRAGGQAPPPGNPRPHSFFVGLLREGRCALAKFFQCSRNPIAIVFILSLPNLP